MLIPPVVILRASLTDLVRGPPPAVIGVLADGYHAVAHRGFLSSGTEGGTDRGSFVSTGGKVLPVACSKSRASSSTSAAGATEPSIFVLPSEM